MHHLNLGHDVTFVTHPAGAICIALAIITFIAVPRVKGWPLFLLFAATIIAGIIGYYQIP